MPDLSPPTLLYDSAAGVRLYPKRGIRTAHPGVRVRCVSQPDQSHILDISRRKAASRRAPRKTLAIRSQQSARIRISWVTTPSDTVPRSPCKKDTVLTL